MSSPPQHSPIKLSALHPRYEHAKRERVMAELAPGILELAQLARSYAIGFTIDAEEADRLELSLDLIEATFSDSSLDGWEGYGLACRPTRSARRTCSTSSPTWPAASAGACRCAWSRAPTGMRK
jgi:L-proline dehydrogenase (EC 1.5.99.8)/delta-1-pyrroline-5-carboxylate dehydrogenase (EC 1.5.1.12)